MCFETENGILSKKGKYSRCFDCYTQKDAFRLSAKEKWVGIIGYFCYNQSEGIVNDINLQTANNLCPNLFTSGNQ